MFLDGCSSKQLKNIIGKNGENVDPQALYYLAIENKFKCGVVLIHPRFALVLDKCFYKVDTSKFDKITVVDIDTNSPHNVDDIKRKDSKSRLVNYDVAVIIVSSSKQIQDFNVNQLDLTLEIERNIDQIYQDLVEITENSFLIKMKKLRRNNYLDFPGNFLVKNSFYLK